MPRTTYLLAAAVAVLAGAANAQAPASPAPLSSPPVITIRTEPVQHSPEMQRLAASAQQLRDAIQVLAQRAPGPERNVAIAKAQEALVRTQQAMLDLPPEYRTATTATTTVPRGYDQSVRSLMAAADTLRQSIHSMAREPAGERRNQAIRDANRALMDTQVAMANAYDVTAFGPNTASLGAGPGSAPTQCVWLGTMWGCR